MNKKLLKDILSYHLYPYHFYIIIIIKIKVLSAFTMQGTRWAGLATRINPGVYGVNEEIVSRAFTKPKARGRTFVLEFVNMKSTNVPGLNNEPPWCFGAGLWFLEAAALYSNAGFYASFKKDTFHI